MLWSAYLTENACAEPLNVAPEVRCGGSTKFRHPTLGALDIHSLPFNWIQVAKRCPTAYRLYIRARLWRCRVRRANEVQVVSAQDSGRTAKTSGLPHASWRSQGLHKNAQKPYTVLPSPVYVPFSKMHLIYSRKKGCLMRLVRNDAWMSYTITVLRTFR